MNVERGTNDKQEEAMKDVDMHDYIDEDLHSRQLAVYGRDSMKKMAQADILIIGLGGVGVEIAKNIILAGVKSVTIQDTKEVSMDDLSSQFNLTEKDIGRNRAEASQAKLQDLNKAVQVISQTTQFDPSDISKYKVVVLTDSMYDVSIGLNEVCRRCEPPVPFIKVESRGVFGSIFCDFGPKFIVSDIDGEEPKTGIISSVIQGKSTLINCIDDERLEFEDGEYVQLSEVEGAEEFNKLKPIKVKETTPSSFQLDLDSSSFQAYKKGGLVTQVKQPKILTFKSFKESLVEHGEFLLSDWAKFDRPLLLHVAFQALDLFIKQTNTLPKPSDKRDFGIFHDLCIKVNSTLKQDATLDQKVLTHFVDTLQGQINPMSTFLGGLVGQEVVKACSNKFHPIHQWFYFDAIETLPEQLSAQSRAPLNQRYDGQIRVYGRELQKKLENLRIFLVGAGALGCEQLKNIAMMGIGAGPEGQVYVTDDDLIEKSNLSRQFLFRDKDIGGSKSDVAAKAVSGINSHIKIQSFQTRVSGESENIFDEDFWNRLDGVINALDNIKARLYVDQRCVYFNKPLLESGTLGTKCNTQMVIPGLTENYGATTDPPEKSAPMCTLHSFPHNIDHCLTWARSEFIGLMEQGPAEVNTYLASPAKFQEDALKQSSSTSMDAVNTIMKVKEYLLDERTTTFEECLKWARCKFQDLFYNKIAQLTYSFPEDSVTSSGNLFWSPPKRFPRPVVFDANDKNHFNFAYVGAMLRAEIFGIQIPDQYKDFQFAKDYLQAMKVAPFTPQDNVKIETDPNVNTAKSNTQSYDNQIMSENISELNKITQGLDPQKQALKQIMFEKDDDVQMDFVSALANLRARNYQIQEIDKLKARFIAGRIIPAVATATAVATGLVMFELYKVIQNKTLEEYRNTFANLALPLFAMSEPIAPKKTEFNGKSWSVWDRWIVQGDKTVQELVDWLQNEHELAAYSISYGASLLYNNVFPKHRERLAKSFSTLVKEVTKKPMPENQKAIDLVVACENEEGEDVDIPLVTIIYK